MNEMNRHLDEGTIHAWLDGALPPDESARVESHIEACADCAALVAEARGLIAASSRILASLDAVPAGVIPGTDAGTDQLAALRARRQASSRQWWRDRRIVAAASLVFVAGISTVVWRNSPERSPTAPREAAVQVLPVPDSATRAPDVVTGASSAPAAGAQPTNAAKVGAVTPPAAPAPARVAATPPVDSLAERKAVAATSLARGAGVAANEARVTDSTSTTRQAADARRDVARTEQQAAVGQVQQQAPQQATQQANFRLRNIDSTRVAAPPPALAAGARSAASVPTMASAMSDASVSAGRCYTVVVPQAGGNAPIVLDTVRLLDERVPVRSDPSWFRALASGRAVDTLPLMWRSIDSVTVELRSRVEADSLVVRFSTSGVAVPGEPGVRTAGSRRIACR
jgi:anti-sigma factor RsiW